MARGTLTFVFDDGYRAVLEQVVPLLDEHSVPGVFAIPFDFVAEPPPAPVGYYKEWRSALEGTSHELAAHSATHVDLTQLEAVQLGYELIMPAERLGATTLVYPGGASNQQVVSAATRYYTAARTTEWGFNSVPPADPYALKTTNYSKRNWSLWQANLRVLWAWLTGRWLIETYHLITDEPSQYEFTVPLKDFKKHVAFIKRLGIPVKTIREVVARDE